MSRPWYRRFPDNFIAGTVGMTLEEKGAYSLVLDLIYVRGGPVPDEPRYIAGVCNCSVRKWNAIRARLIELGKIEAVDGVLINRRAEKEIEMSSESARERAESGRKGGIKSSEIASHHNENNDLAKAEVEHTRASLEAISREEEKQKPSVSPKRGTRWAKGQAVPAEWVDWARTSFPSVSLPQIEAQARQFADYWPAQPGAGAAKLDWEATWRNWLRKAFPGLEQAAGGGSGDAPSSGLVVLSLGDPDFVALERLRGRPVTVGQSGRVTVRAEEVVAARAALVDTS